MLIGLVNAKEKQQLLIKINVHAHIKRKGTLNALGIVVVAKDQKAVILLVFARVILHDAIILLRKNISTIL